MIGYLIYNEFESNRNRWFIDKLISEFAEKKLKLVLIIEEKLIFTICDKPSFFYVNKLLEKPDFVINRTNNYLIAMQFEAMSVRVFNNSYVSQIANNKYLSYLKVSELNVKALNTKLYKKGHDLPNISNSVVIKPLDEKGGKDVYLCNDNDELSQNISKIDKDELLIQKPASDLGKDLRVYILGNKIYKAMLRVNSNNFKSNFCLGNDAVTYELSNREIDVVENILSIASFDYVGIDFLFDNGEIVFNEIEDSVGARMLYSKTKCNIAADFAKYVIATIN